MPRRTSRRSAVRLTAVGLAAAALASNLLAADTTPHDAMHQRKLADMGRAEPLEVDGPLSDVPCVNGRADVFPCSNVHLEAFLPLEDIGGGELNDIWGWTDPETGREYALVGKTTGTAFVDVTDPTAPVYLGDLRSQTISSPWRDIKVLGDTAFIVSEAQLHGVQAFDLRLLRSADGPRPWTTTGWQVPVRDAHNVFTHEASNRVYVVGAASCGGGPYVIDGTTFSPLAQDGCVSIDGYTHDLQCVVYEGPDVEHRGREICLGSNEDTVTVYDLTDLDHPQVLSRTRYDGAAYVHEGWLTEDQRFFLVGDESDEQRGGPLTPTRTYVLDVADLDAPVVIGSHDHATEAIDHNLYVTGNQVHQANYQAGYRLLELTDPASATLTELAFFDVYPAGDFAKFNGAWSVYPFFSSGTVVVSGIEQGLFVLRPTVDWDVPAPAVRPPSPLG